MMTALYVFRWTKLAMVSSFHYFLKIMEKDVRFCEYSMCVRSIKQEIFTKKNIYLLFVSEEQVLVVVVFKFDLCTCI